MWCRCKKRWGSKTSFGGVGNSERREREKQNTSTVAQPFWAHPSNAPKDGPLCRAGTVPSLA